MALDALAGMLARNWNRIIWMEGCYNPATTMIGAFGQIKTIIQRRWRHFGHMRHCHMLRHHGNTWHCCPPHHHGNTQRCIQPHCHCHGDTRRCLPPCHFSDRHCRLLPPHFGNMRHRHLLHHHGNAQQTQQLAKRGMRSKDASDRGKATGNNQLARQKNGMVAQHKR